MSVLDVVLLLVFIGYGLSGLRHGLVVGLFSVAGFIGGAVLAMVIAPHVVGGWEAGRRRTIVTIIGVLAIAWAFQAAGLFVGRQLRSVVTWRPARLVDSLLGGVAALIAVALVTWFLAGAVVQSSFASLSRAVAGSHVVAVVDQLVPAQADGLFSGFRRVVDAQDFPRVFDGVTEPTARDVPAPDAGAVSAAATTAQASTVKITGTAPSCSRGREGSGFVIAPHRVVTNAHVVAGVTSPTVQVGGAGAQLPATVVRYDPERDLAVLAVPALRAPALALGTNVSGGDDAVLVGFPEDGGYTATPARVREVERARGADIYDRGSVVRMVYSLAAKVLPGNSGGPLLDAKGQLVGVVFARSLDESDTGYALTLSEAEPDLNGVASLTRAVSTQGCTSS